MFIDVFESINVSNHIFSKKRPGDFFQFQENGGIYHLDQRSCILDKFVYYNRNKSSVGLFWACPGFGKIEGQLFIPQEELFIPRSEGCLAEAVGQG